MLVCVLYAGRTREGGKLKAIADSLAHGIASQGHQVDVVNIYDGETRLTPYDYVVIGSEPVSFFSAAVPANIQKFLHFRGAQKEQDTSQPHENNGR